ncbi:TPA: hypothetical protein ACK3Q6_004485 [Burkholderia cepacia]
MDTRPIDRITGEIAECEARFVRAHGTIAAPAIRAELNYLRHTKRVWLKEINDDDCEYLEEIEGATVVRKGEGEEAFVLGIGEDGESLFVVPADWTLAQIQMAVTIYRNGERYGTETGRNTMKAEIRAAIDKIKIG